MLYRFGLLMVRLRWWAIGAWSVALLASLALAPSAASFLKSGFGEVDTESRTALRLLADRMGASEASVTLVFTGETLPATDPAYAEAVDRAVAPLLELPQVSRVVTFHGTGNPHMVADDGRTTYAFVMLDTGIDEAVNLFPAIRERLEPGPLQVWATGGVAIYSDLNQASEADLRRAEMVTLPLVLLALLLVFGSIVAAALPVAMGGLSIATTFAVVYLLAQRVDTSIFVLNIASFLGLGMAIDYSLLMVSRFREELGTHPVEEAVARTCATAGRAIFFSAATSIIALSGLLFFKFMMLRSLGIGGTTVIFLSLLIALTLMPAVLGVLGTRVNAWPILPRPRRQTRFWLRLSGWVMRHPAAVIVPVTALLLLLGAPFLGVTLGTSWASVLPPGAEARQGWAVVEDRFGPGELAPIIVASVSDSGVLEPGNVGAVYDFVQRTSRDPRVARVDSIVSLAPGMTREQYQALYASPSLERVAPAALVQAVGALTGPRGDITTIRVVPAVDPVSDEARALVADLRASPPGGDMRSYVTGVTADLMDTVDRMYADFPRIVAFVVVVTYVALFWLFRSVLLPLKAVAMNALSVLAAFGALVAVFQWGVLEGVLGIPASGYVEASVPILLFSIVFGLSMDYEVFLLTRIKEEYDVTGDNAAAVGVGMERSGRIITSAALILILVSAGFATGDILVVRALGFGVAVAIFVDATIVRALLVPALMRVMSGLNWWAPRFLGGPGRAAGAGKG